MVRRIKTRTSPTWLSFLKSTNMGYRRDNAETAVWQRWLARARPTLERCGVPIEAYADQRSWWYFLDHATMSTGQDVHWFVPEHLTEMQLAELCTFLEIELETEERRHIS